MKLLIDNNLSYKLCAPLQIYFPGTDHVRNLLTVVADDISIWNFARENGYDILTKDNDFNERSLLKGCPPKIIHLLCGNQSTQNILEMLLRNAEVIKQFTESTSSDCILKLYF